MGSIGPHPGSLAVVVAALTRGRGGGPIYRCPRAHFWVVRGAGGALLRGSGALLLKIGVLMAESGEGNEALAWRALSRQGKRDCTPLARLSFGKEAPHPRLPPCLAVEL